jgi:hypothetical protein
VCASNSVFKACSKADSTDSSNLSLGDGGIKSTEEISKVTGIFDRRLLSSFVGVAVGGTTVAVGGIGVAVGGIGVAVGGIGVAVGGIGVAVGGIGVAVGGIGVAVAAGAVSLSWLSFCSWFDPSVSLVPAVFTELSLRASSVLVVLWSPELQAVTENKANMHINTIGIVL